MICPVGTRPRGRSAFPQPSSMTAPCCGSLRSGTPFEMEFPIRRADSVFRWFLTRATPLRDERSRIVRWFGTNTDIEDLKRTREELAANEERLRRIVDSEMVGIIFWRRDGRLVDANDEFLRMLGETPVEDHCGDDMITM